MRTDTLENIVKTKKISSRRGRSRPTEIMVDGLKQFVWKYVIYMINPDLQGLRNARSH